MSYICHNVNTTLMDSYRVTDQCIGYGLNGKIRTVICKNTGEEFALKTINLTTNTQLKRSKAETNAFKIGSGHKNIVQLKEVITDDQSFYFVMEKLNGGDLLDYIIRKERVEENVAAKIMKGIASALSTFHSHGIAHRDIKPDNIFCYDTDNIFPIKLGDYGLATNPTNLPCCEDHGKNVFSDQVGTCDYMAPEVADLFLGKYGHYTEQCDMWSLGVVLYIMLYGDKPFYIKKSKFCTCRRNDERCEYCFDDLLMVITKGRYNLWDTISEEAKDLLRNLLKVDPKERYTADQVLEHPWIKAYNNAED